jgi:ParB family transcriptional regulator, chromosome partitioning protein
MSKLDKMRAVAEKRVNSISERFAEVSTRSISKFELDLIDPDPNQPRHEFDADELEGLAVSIREHGVLEPILLRRNGERFWLIAGERRWRASKLAGETHIAAVIRDDLTPDAILEVQLIENLEREDLNPYDKTLAILKLIGVRAGATQDEVIAEVRRKAALELSQAPTGEREGQSDTGIRHDLSIVTDEVLGRFELRPITFSRFHLKLLQLPVSVLSAIQANDLAYSLGVMIGAIKDEAQRDLVLAETLKHKLSRRALHDLIRKSTKTPTVARSITAPIDLRRTQRSLAGIKKKIVDLEPSMQLWVTEQVQRIQQAIRDGTPPG